MQASKVPQRQYAIPRPAMDHSQRARMKDPCLPAVQDQALESDEAHRRTRATILLCVYNQQVTHESRSLPSMDFPSLLELVRGTMLRGRPPWARTCTGIAWAHLKR